MPPVNRYDEAHFARLEALGSCSQPNEPVLRLELAQCTPEAFLVGSGIDQPVVFPLGRGRTIVGRRHHSYFENIPRALLEGAQWIFNLDERGARVVDARSTNGSCLVRRSARTTTELSFAHLYESHNSKPLEWLGWDGKLMHDEPRTIEPGDVLVCVYSWFLFCSVRA